MKYDVFLAGPITGVTDYRARFAYVEKKMRAAYGHDVMVWNPARLPGGYATRWYMIRCFFALFRSRRVVALDGWEKSKGATIEVSTARYIGVPVFGATHGGLFQ